MNRSEQNSDPPPLEAAIGTLLRAGGMSLAIAESCTGGLICHRVTSVAGSSDYFERGVVAYSNQAKTDLLHVPADLLETHGAVSAPCAEAMAQGVRTSANAHIGLSVTGIAGPTGGSPHKPVGTVFIGIATEKGALSERFLFAGNRAEIQRSSAETALSWVWRFLNHDPYFHRL